MTAREPRASDPPAADRGSAGRAALLLAGAVTVADCLAVAFAFQPGRSGPALIGSIGAVYLVFTAVAFVRLRRRGELSTFARPAAGDIALGAVVATILYFGSMGARHLLAPHGHPREAWVVHLYLLFGDPADASPYVGLAVFVVAALEEITWRGLVAKALQEVYGPLVAVTLSSVLFAVAHLPTVMLLADGTAGPNPLVAMAALGCALVWGYVMVRTGRLVPAIFAHALFSWAVVEYPLWRP